MGLGFPFFPVHKTEYPRAQLGAEPKCTDLPEGQISASCTQQAQKQIHCYRLSRAGKIPGTFGVEVRGLREKPEASRAFSHIMDESRAGKSCHIAKYVKFWHRVDCTSNAQCAGLGKSWQERE